MTIHMNRQPREPCSLCCGIISYITKGLAEKSAETIIDQPPWHGTTEEIRESGQYCLLCETIWQAIILPRLKEVTHDYPGLAALLVSLKFGSHHKANGVHWANVYTTLTADREKFVIMRVDSIGISLQPQGSSR